MPAAGPVARVPVTSVAGAIARMEAIGASVPAEDGLGCFNRMYLEVTKQVEGRLGAGFFADPAFMTQLDVTFANLYFTAVDAAGNPPAVPLAWRPLIEQRAQRPRPRGRELTCPPHGPGWAHWLTGRAGGPARLTSARRSGRSGTPARCSRGLPSARTGSRSVSRSVA